MLTLPCRFADCMPSCLSYYCFPLSIVCLLLSQLAFLFQNRIQVLMVLSLSLHSSFILSVRVCVSLSLSHSHSLVSMSLQMCGCRAHFFCSQNCGHLLQCCSASPLFIWYCHQEYHGSKTDSCADSMNVDFLSYALMSISTMRPMRGSQSSHQWSDRPTSN